jgi:uncharacterized membrane protein SirB2
MLAPHFLEIRAIHVGCVALSGSLFTIRGLMRLNDVAEANHVALRITSIAIDSVLLTAAVLLTVILHQYPFINGWLTVKLVLLVLYVTLGSMALRVAKTRVGQITAFGAALLTFAAIIGVAITRQPLGWLTLLH